MSWDLSLVGRGPGRSIFVLVCGGRNGQTMRQADMRLKVPRWRHDMETFHYNDVTMAATASLITSLTIVYSTVYSSADQRKHQSSAPLAFCAGNSPETGEFPAQMASSAENVSIWWRHHVSTLLTFNQWWFYSHMDSYEELWCFFSWRPGQAVEHGIELSGSETHWRSCDVTVMQNSPTNSFATITHHTCIEILTT